MATRLYFPDRTPADVQPVVSGGTVWGASWTGNVFRKLTTYKGEDAFASDPFNVEAFNTAGSLIPRHGGQSVLWTAGQTALDRTYVSPPLNGAQSVTGTLVAAQLMAKETAATGNVNTRLEIYVVSENGQTVRGTCLALGQAGITTELLDTGWRNKSWCAANTAISTVAAQDGDRIVVKIGLSDAAGTTPAAFMKYGAPSGTADLPADETTTTDGVGWIEFSANLVFKAEMRAANTALLRKSAGSVYLVQKTERHRDTTAAVGAGITSAAIPFNAATAGNLLVLAIAIDKSSGAWGAAPTGWSTVITPIVGTNISMAVYYKVAAGGETTVTATWTTTHWWAATVMEWAGITAAPLGETAITNADATTQTTLSSGTTAVLAQARNLALSFFSVDSKITGWAAKSSWPAYNNGFPGFPSPYTFSAGWTEVAHAGAVQDIGSGATPGNPGLAVVSQITTATTAVSSTFTAGAGATADNMLGAVAVFKLADEVGTATTSNTATLEASGGTTATARSSTAATLESTATARTSTLSSLEKTAMALVSTIALLDATGTARAAHTATLERTSTARASTTATLEQASTARASNHALLEVPANVRAALTATLEQTSTTRASNVASFEPDATSRTSTTALLEQTSTARSSTTATLELPTTTATVRASTTAALESTATTRASTTALLDQAATARSSTIATLEQTAASRSSTTSTLESTATARSATTASLEKTGTARTSTGATLDQTAATRSSTTATLQPPEITATARSSNLARFSTTTLNRRWAGAATSSGVTISVHPTTGAGTVFVDIYKVSDNSFAGTFSAATGTGDWAKIVITGLAANTQYYYAPRVGNAEGPRSKFRTFPVSGTAASFSFIFSSCTDGVDDAGVAANTGAGFARVAAHDPLFYAHLGDLHYRDSATTDEAIRRGFYDSNLSNATQTGNLYGQHSLAYIWSDHDYCGGNSHAGSTGKASALAAYRTAFPHYPMAVGSGVSDPLSQAWTIGRVRFILTDNRSQRSSDADADGTSKTLFGAAQKTWFKNEITAAKAAGQAVVWLCEHNWNGGNGPSGTPARPAALGSDDGWDKYMTERREIADFINGEGMSRRMVICMGDAHMIAIDDGTNSNYTTGSDGVGDPLAMPLIHGGGLARGAASAKGGPFSQGSAAPANQIHYGKVTVTDTGGATLQILLQAYNTANDLTSVTPYTLTTDDLGNITATARAATTAALEASAAPRASTTALLETAATARSASTATLESSATARASSLASLESTSTARASTAASLEQTSTARTSTTALLEQTVTARASMTASFAPEGTVRASTAATLETSTTARAANTASLEQTNTARSSTTSTLDQTATTRAATAATLETTGTARAATTTTLETTATARGATTATLEQAAAARAATSAALEAPATARAANAALLEKTTTARSSTSAGLEVTGTARAASTTTLDTTAITSTVRASNTTTLVQSSGGSAAILAAAFFFMD